MISVSTKMTLALLILPISFLVISDAIIYYFHNTLTIEISELLTAILVFLLVWERLRESLTKRLEYLHKNMFFKLYSIFGSSDLIYFQQDEIKRIRNDLERYGKFMGISLYPRDLLKEIDKLLSLYSKFRKRIDILGELAEELIGKNNVHKELLWKFLGIRQDSRVRAVSTYNPQEIQLHEEKVEIIKKEKPQLIEETKQYDEKMIEITKRLSNKLENFLKTNNLRLEEERTYSPYR